MFKPTSSFFTALLVFFASTAVAGEAARVTAVVGKAELNGQAIVADQVVYENAHIKTSAQTYVYLKTVDDGFLVVRPNSEVRIVDYHIDPSAPAGHRFKLELIAGVVRSVSGTAVKQARQNFRFNTPVAAIGVRGTDFTVFADQQSTRVAVTEGGVIVSPFNQQCQASGVGPCEGSQAIELFARQQGGWVQVTRGQAKAQIVSPAGVVSDLANPGSDDAGKSKATINTGISDPNLDPNKLNNLKVVSQSTTIPGGTGVTDGGATNGGGGSVDPNAQLKDTISWGRWREVLGQASEVTSDSSSVQKTLTAGQNSYYKVLVNRDQSWQLPNSGVYGFALQGSQSVVKNELTGQETMASIQNAALQINFATTSFTTSFDLLSGNSKYALSARGLVGNDGLFGSGGAYPDSMIVSGVVTPEKGGSAAYVFNARITADSVAQGVTFWQKK